MTMVAVSIGTAAVGAGTAIYGAVKKGQAQRAMSRAQTPFYQPNKSLMDYYSEALNRYNVNPYSSLMYQTAENNANRSLAAGIGSLQDRRAGVGTIGALMGQNNMAMQNAGVQAEAQRNRDFGILGQAANMGAGDNRLQYQYNQLLPYQKRMSILGAQAEGAAQTENAGLTNMSNGIYGAAATGAFKSNPSSAMGSYATYNPALAQTAGSYTSPANGISTIGPSPANNLNYINPNSYSNL